MIDYVAQKDTPSSSNTNSSNNSTTNTVNQNETMLNINSGISIRDQEILRLANMRLQKELAYKNKMTKCKQRMIFFPIIFFVIWSPCFMVLSCLRYCFHEEQRERNCFYFIIFLLIYITFLYLLSALTKSTVSDVSKFFDPSNSILNIDQTKPGKEIKNINPFEWSFCKYCNKPKFKRSSHCRICKECILLRDHHCPWVANCVGYCNYQYFVNFLVWAVIGITYYFYLTFKFSRYFDENEYKSKINNPKIALICNYIICFIMLLFYINVMNVFFNTIINIYGGVSFLERLRNFSLERYVPFVSKNNNNFNVNVYNLGYLTNFYYNIGPTLLHLFLPLPKNLSFTLKEELPIFKGIAVADKITLIKHLSTIEPRYKEVMSNKENDPDYYISLCHKYYDDKEIA